MKNPTRPAGLAGRRAQAGRNDQRILDSARTVLMNRPDAPISAVAAHAGVGISAIYRRYPSKAKLLRELCFDGLRRYIAVAQAALAEDGDSWTVYARFMRGIVDADTHAMLRFAGTFRPTEALYKEAAKALELNVRLFNRTKAAGAIRDDIDVVDIAPLFEQLAAIRIGDQHRTAQLRQRYLALILDALHDSSGQPLPGPEPTWDEVNSRLGRVSARNRTTARVPFYAFGAEEDERGYMSRYGFEESIRDGATLPLHFEPRLIDLHIDRAAIDEGYAELSGGLSDLDKENLAKTASRMAVLVKAASRIKAICPMLRTITQDKVAPNGFKALIRGERKQNIYVTF